MSGGMIMVIDDDDGLRMTVSAILEEEGYEVVIAGDGVDALAKLQERRPALILLDIGMPRMNGYDFSDELRRGGLHATIPILVFTADGRAAQKAQRVGARGYVAKPFSIDHLLDQIDRILTSAG